ncbi:MAG TPA: hypothetical protein PLU71_04255 [Candidatus Dependentiae bacterium]|nr:hypothetical protein [Candidatus Dependentiae bacterium]HRQ63045.1 hypothetical protein [Candidatus Dependentiae bacterium]
MKHAHNAGYILLVTLMMITGAIAVGTYIFLRGSVYLPFMRSHIERQKAIMFAQGGLAIAQSQLTLFVAPKDQKEENTNQQSDPAKQLWERITPTINRWQTYQLKKNIDGIDGVIKICLGAEEGKIDLNTVYDYKKKEFKGKGQPTADWHKLMEVVCKRIEVLTGAKDTFNALSAFLKKRSRPLNDVTELLTIKEFDVFRNAVFYEPRTQESKDVVIYLTDIFTVHSRTDTLQPWLFSDSLLGILQIKQAQPGDSAKREDVIKKLNKKFKKTVQWKQDWDELLKPLYEKELQSLPNGLDSVLDVTFEPTTFTVLVHGTVGLVTQRLLAIVERYSRVRNSKIEYNVSIKKLYWL